MESNLELTVDKDCKCAPWHRPPGTPARRRECVRPARSPCWDVRWASREARRVRGRVTHGWCEM